MLTKTVREYVALRRALGFDIRVAACLLEHFAAHATDRGETHVRASTAVTWAASAPSPSQRTRRLDVVRRFARHVALDDRRHEIPPKKAFGPPPPRRMPYIFAAKDISRIVAAASKLTPPRSLRPLTYATLFGLIASTGLRVSEALRVQIPDVTPDGLVVRQTKFRKTRLVPLHSTTRDALERYLHERSRFDTPDQSVFISTRGWKLSYGTVIAVFLSIVRALGLRGPTGRGPRIHDLRHTFAVRSLERCAMEHRAVAHHALALSTYLGHAHIEDTYWYLHATPELLGDIADAAEALLERGAT